jgi:hypothetical protein
MSEGTSAVKKVRLAIGTVGGASALGMMVTGTAAHAANTPGHTSVDSAGKTVVLAHGNARAEPDAECGVNAAANGYGNSLYGAIEYRGSCVGFQSAEVSGHPTGLTERVRFWKDGDLEATKWVNPGTFYTSSDGRKYTRFWSSPYEHVSEVCEALVLNGNHASVIYGPACERD